MFEPEFFTTLSPLEQEYCQKLAEVFSWVNPQKPEKGIQTLIRKARQLAQQNNTPLAEALETQYQAAKARTLKRLALLGQCHIPNPPPKQE